MNKLRVIFLSFLCALFVATPVAATTSTTYRYSSADNFYFEDFIADYYLWRDEDGTSRMRVIEQLTAVFPETNQNHGFNRIIVFTNQNGKNLTMSSDDTLYINVERNGKEEPIDKVEVGDGHFNVYIGDSSTYVHGRQVYTLEYEFENLITAPEGTSWQELYWDTNGNDWKQRFGSLTARIHLDANIAQDFTGDTACYVGSYGETGSTRCETIKTEDGFEFSTSSLRPGENLSFVMKFDPDTFTVPGPRYDYRLVILGVVIFIAGAAMIILMVVTWRTVSEKHKYYKSLFVKPEYTPPVGFTVAEMASNYIGSGANGNSKVATLLELAVQHKIELIKSEKDAAFGKKKTVWKIRIISADLTPEQVVVLKILAGSNAQLQKGQEISVEKHTANSTLTSLASKFETYLQKNLQTKGLSVPTNDKKAKKSAEPTAKPATETHKTHNLASTLIVVAAVWIFVWGFVFSIVFSEAPSYVELVGDSYLPALIVLTYLIIFVAAVIVFGRTNAYYVHTEKGLEFSRYLDGLKLYIKMAEADRLKFLQSVDGADTSHTGVVKLYEKLLPYAVIFRMEKSWLEEMSRYYEYADVAEPTWYIGMGAFSAHEFASAMTAASTTMNSTIAHSTTSNSSSGGSGFSGGFSGGGGGGGGGGGW